MVLWNKNASSILQIRARFFNFVAGLCLRNIEESLYE